MRRRFRTATAIVAASFVAAQGSPAPGVAALTQVVTVARGAHAAVATDALLASQTGLRVLRAGGNAVDAAVAIGYTLAVTYPEAGNLGGGGFMLVRLRGGATHFIDFRETAPAAATRDMYLDRDGTVVPKRSLVGALAAGVPGTVAGLEYARTTLGTRSRHELMRDAIRYATDGFAIRAVDAAPFARWRDELHAFPSTAAVFVARGATPQAGSMLRQPDLARTLERIEAHGPAGFYRGPVAAELVGAVARAGGIISASDLAGYRAVERAPIVCTYRGMRVITAPLPSSGGVTMCEVFGMLAHDVPQRPIRSFANVHLEVEAERRAFADRNTQLADPAFVRSKVSALLDPAYLARLRASFTPDRATPSSAISRSTAMHEGSNTTNYSVVDSAGNAVDVTYTLNNTFGSDFVAGRTGVLLNDEMDDFSVKPGVANLFGLVQGTANAIEPGKRPLSSMTPSIVVDAAGRTVLVAGAAGGPRIISTTLDTIRAVVDFGQDAATALAGPRMHMQWLPDAIVAQPGTFDPATLTRLRAAGYTIEVRRRSGSIANAVEILADGTREGAHEPSLPTGAALAY